MRTVASLLLLFALAALGPAGCPGKDPCPTTCGLDRRPPPGCCP